MSIKGTLCDFTVQVIRSNLTRRNCGWMFCVFGTERKWTFMKVRREFGAAESSTPPSPTHSINRGEIRGLSDYLPSPTLLSPTADDVDFC